MSDIRSEIMIYCSARASPCSYIYDYIFDDIPTEMIILNSVIPFTDFGTLRYDVSYNVALMKANLHAKKAIINDNLNVM